MPDLRLEKYADLLVNYSLDVKPGDLMRIRGSSVGEPLAVAVFQAAVKIGAHPYFAMTPEEALEIQLRDAPETALDYISPIDQFAIENLDVDFSIFGDYNSYSLSGIDPKRVARAQKARGAVDAPVYGARRSRQTALVRRAVSEPIGGAGRANVAARLLGVRLQGDIDRPAGPGGGLAGSSREAKGLLRVFGIEERV